MLGQNVALELMKIAIRAADPASAIKQHVRVLGSDLFVRKQKMINLHAFDRTYVFGAGKAACEMASACCDVGLKIDGGMIVTKTKHAKPSHIAVCQKSSIKIEEASHPIPCERGERATKELISMIQEVSGPRTLILWLASGGGSALTGGVGVTPHLTLNALQDCMQWLLDSGAEIEQVNAIRKHLCAAHGGRVAVAAGESTVLTLCVSDIIGSPLSAIAGGPTTADPTTVQDCRDILMKLSKARDLSSNLRRAFFSEQSRDLVPETPKALPKNILPGLILVDLALAIEAAVDHCKRQYPKANVLVLSSRLSGEASDLGRTLATIGADTTLKRPFVILAGGETTVTMDSRKAGKGGRNQELALAAAVQLYRAERGSPDVCVLSIGTDGTDGPTNAAGAVVTKETIRADTLDQAMASLANHDSYNYFNTNAREAHILTGPTGTNVMDLMMICDFGPTSKY